jgi:GxxExxY protein
MREKLKSESAKRAETLALRSAGGSDLREVTRQIIGAAIEVHRHLGPGLLESAYEECLCYELSQSGLRFQRQLAIPVQYKGLRLSCDYRLDLIVEDSVIVEIKTVDQLAPIHTAQLLTYLKATNRSLGLLINFNVPVLKDGVKRLANHYVQPGNDASVSAPSANESREDAGPDSLVTSLRVSPDLGVSAVNRRAQ